MRREKMKKNVELFEVAEKQCDQCLFTERRIVSEARKEKIIASCQRSDLYFSCHKFQQAGRDVCCRGFYDNEKTLVIKLAEILGRVRFVRMVRKIV
jgi:hypothetical protein